MNIRSFRMAPWLFAAVVGATLVLPFAFAEAQALFPGDLGPSGLVPCGDPGEPPCNVCDLVNLAQDIVNFSMFLLSIVGALLLMYAGFKYATAGGDTGKISDAHSIFKKAVIGILIVLAAWLAVDTIMKAFFAESPLGKLGPWNEICKGGVLPTPAPAAPAAPSTQPPPSAEEPGLTITAPCGVAGYACQALNASVPIKPTNACSAQVCTVEVGLNDRLYQMTDKLGAAGIESNEWWVTEAYPPTVQHQNSCHLNATCVDANFRSASNATSDNILAFQQAAQASDLRAVYEVSSASRAAELKAAGVTNIQVVPGINGEHFSVYKK